MLNRPKVGMAIPTQMCSQSSQVSPPATPALSATTTSTLRRRVGTFSPSSVPLAMQRRIRLQLPQPGMIQPVFRVPLW